MITEMVFASAVEIAQRRSGRAGARIYSGRPWALVLRNFMALKTSNALVFFSGFVEPIFFLLAFGFGLGNFVGDVGDAGGPQVSYAAYIAPALLATSAMNGALADATWNVFFKMHFGKFYNAVMATSLGALDTALGEIGWAVIRGAAYAVGFVAVITPLGLMPSHWGYLAIPAAALVAFGFAAVGMALTSYAESMQQLNWVSFWLLPMFLFSGAFFPLDGYPWAAQQVIHALPLWQAIAMLRALMYGQLDVALLGHVAYFVVFVLVGVAFTTKRLNALFLR